MENPNTINVVMPVYNEEAVLEKNINLLKKYFEDNLASYNWQIIIADNASLDLTATIGKKLSEQKKIKYFFIPQKGRGLALYRVFLETDADFYLYMDIDLATDLSALPDLVKSLDKEKYDLVTGSRFLKKSKITRSLLREIISRGYIFLVKTMFQTKLSDMQCGFKGLNKKIATELVPLTKDKEWFFDTELMLLAEKMGYRIKEIPITWVEKRVMGRKSKVKLVKSIYQFLQNLLQFRRRLKNN